MLMARLAPIMPRPPIDMTVPRTSGDSNARTSGMISTSTKPAQKLIAPRKTVRATRPRRAATQRHAWANSRSSDNG
jgi:hypothetical protein